MDMDINVHQTFKHTYTQTQTTIDRCLCSTEITPKFVHCSLWTQVCMHEEMTGNDRLTEAKEWRSPVPVVCGLDGKQQTTTTKKEHVLWNGNGNGITWRLGVVWRWPHDLHSLSLTLLILLVLGRVWLMCRSVYLSGLLMSHGTDSVRTSRAAGKRHCQNNKTRKQNTKKYI